MATAQQTEQAYSGHESVGVAVSPFTRMPSQALSHRAPNFLRQVLVGCGMVSLICVLSMFLILGVCTFQL